MAEIALADLCWGSAEMPELSATLLAQVPALQSDRKVVLTGPAILTSHGFSRFTDEILGKTGRCNHAAYPKGVDLFLFDDRAVMGVCHARPLFKQAMLS